MPITASLMPLEATLCQSSRNVWAAKLVHIAAELSKRTTRTRHAAQLQRTQLSCWLCIRLQLRSELRLTCVVQGICMRCGVRHLTSQLQPIVGHRGQGLTVDKSVEGQDGARMHPLRHSTKDLRCVCTLGKLSSLALQ